MSNFIKPLLAGVVLIGLATQSFGAVVTLVNSSAYGKSWENGVDWSDGDPAGPGNEYHVGNGKVLRTPENASPVFPGDSLTIDASGSLALKNSGTMIINGFHLNGGSVHQWVGNSTIGIGGTITVDAASSFAADDPTRFIDIAGLLTGGGNLTINSGGSTGGLLVTGTGNTYTGTWIVNNGTFDAQGAGSLGSGNLTVNTNGNVDIDYDVATTAILTLNGQMTLDQDHAFGRVIVAGTTLAPGTHDFATLNGSFDGQFVDGGTGSISVHRTFKLNRSQSSSGTVWMEPGDWTDLADDTAGVIPSDPSDTANVATVLRTPSSGSHVFAPQMNLQSGAVLALKTTGTMTFDNMHLQGGQIGMWTGGTATVDGMLTVDTSARFSSLTGRTVALAGQLTGPGNLTFTDGGTFLLTNANSDMTGTITATNSIMVVDGTLANSPLTMTGGRLMGAGTIASTVSVRGATLAPGNSAGILHTGDIDLNAASFFEVELTGPSVGTEYDQLDVTGTVDLGGAELQLLLGFDPNVGDSFIIVNNDSDDPIVGTFTDLAEGDSVEALYGGTSYSLVISYAGGTGNDVQLATVPEPTTLGLLTLGVMGLLLVRRRGR